MNQKDTTSRFGILDYLHDIRSRKEDGGLLDDVRQQIELLVPGPTRNAAALLFDTTRNSNSSNIVERWRYLKCDRVVSTFFPRGLNVGLDDVCLVATFNCVASSDENAQKGWEAVYNFLSVEREFLGLGVRTH